MLTEDFSIAASDLHHRGLFPWEAEHRTEEIEATLDFPEFLMPFRREELGRIWSQPAETFVQPVTGFHEEDSNLCVC